MNMDTVTMWSAAPLGFESRFEYVAFIQSALPSFLLIDCFLGAQIGIFTGTT
jgi:hypothetical protein